MAITAISDTAVAVETYTDLSDVLANSTKAYTEITTVYLAADIQMGSTGINLDIARTKLTLDGQDPFTGEIHQMFDYNTSSYSLNIGVRTANATMDIVYQNIKWTGQNYYGIFYTPDGTSYQNVSITYRDMEYTGPQMSFHNTGMTRFIDCTIVLQAAYSAVNEVAEVNKVEIGGETTIDNTASSLAVFYFRSTASPSLKILEGANVTIDAGREVCWIDADPCSFTMEPGSSLNVTAQRGMCYSSTHRLSPILIDEDCIFKVKSSASASPAALIYCDGKFTVNEGATVYLEDASTATLPLVYFSGTGTSLNINNPDSFVVYNTAAAFTFPSATQFNLTAGQMNQWTTATKPVSAAGGFDDVPPKSWRKADNTAVALTGTTSNTVTTISTSNLEADDPATDVSEFKLAVVQVFSAGYLPISLPAVIDDGSPIIGRTAPGAVSKAVFTTENEIFNETQIADEEGKFSFDTQYSISAGTDVSIAVNRQFLLVQEMVKAVAAGEIYVLEPPASLDFEIAPVAKSPVLFGRADSDWKLEVYDSRGRSTSWRLYVTSNRDLTCYNERDEVKWTLPNAMVYVDDENELKQISDVPVLIWRGSANGGLIITHEVMWEAAKGLLLTASSSPYRTGEKYTADLTWILETDEFVY